MRYVFRFDCCIVLNYLVKNHPNSFSFVVDKEKKNILSYIKRIFGLIIVQSITFIARTFNRFFNRLPPFSTEMVAPDNVAAATAAANDIPLPGEPMVVDNGVLDILRSVAHHSGFTVDLLLRAAAGREPGEDPTMGDMARLGQIFSEKVFGTDQLLVARQLEAKEDANRRQTEMAVDINHADEYNDIYNEL